MWVKGRSFFGQGFYGAFDKEKDNAKLNVACISYAVYGRYSSQRKYGETVT
jgi:hypothetical protein